MHRQQTIGCIWGIHGLIAFVFVGLAIGCYLRSDGLLFYLCSLMAVLETVFLFGVRFCMGRRWVWFLGYVCWLSLIVLGFVCCLLMLADVKDGPGFGLVLFMGLPLFLGIAISSMVGVVLWNKLEVEAK